MSEPTTTNSGNTDAVAQPDAVVGKTEATTFSRFYHTQTLRREAPIRNYGKRHCNT